MQVTYPNTPGVKIKEVATLPRSIVQVSTAIPVFVGYTKNTVDSAVRISSLSDYEQKFGGPYAHTFELTETNGTLNIPGLPTKRDYFFYEAISLYFSNGGGDCYIISIGIHDDAFTSPDFINGITKIEALDEPTLIAFPEAIVLTTDAYAEVAKAALTVCNNSKDKFAILDQSKDTNLLNRLPYTPANGSSTPAVNPDGELHFRASLGTGNLSYGAVYYPSLTTSLKYTINENTSKVGTTTFKDLKNTGSAKYQKALQIIHDNLQIVVPPSSIIAGVYAKNDREKGFWQAPANVSLQGVISPTVAISAAQQENLNVDAISGKSINAIRTFAGKGTLVWGARTLDGNSNEWRYISVRRLFMTVEESVKKATSQFVFENNDAKTWVTINAMISSYLNTLWKDGALMGAAASEAYFVQVGLGTTMTQQDILEGKMIVKIGLAAVRPAEFIILEFSHYIGQ